MRNFQENTSSAFRTLRENWLRTALTMLGIVIGVGSVVLLVAIGQGVKVDITHQIESLGTNTVIVIPGKLDSSGQPNLMATLGISTLTDKDVADLSRLPGIADCAPIMFLAGTLEREKKPYSALVVASSSSIFNMRAQTFEEGRFYRPDEETQRVCVMASGPKKETFGTFKAVGQSIMVRGISYRIIGVMAPEEESLFAAGSFSNVVYVPLLAAKAAYQGKGQLNRIFLQTDYKQAPGPILVSIKDLLLRNHNGTEDFGLITMKQLLGAIYRVFNIVTALLAGISAISLVVAGIGIMNIMLVTVTERTREIGIRKTVGARRQDIFLQFLTEAVTLAFSGGVIGTLLTVVICVIVAGRSTLRPMVTPGAVLMAFGVCFLVGVVFGVAPAMRAARQDPIEALRHE